MKLIISPPAHEVKPYFPMARKFSKSERVVVEEGITHIRPVAFGIPGPTEKEVDEAIANFNATIQKEWVDENVTFEQHA
jgi:hypothetical protein